jgi:surface carbohydrate biosynthesis protein
MVTYRTLNLLFKEKMLQSKRLIYIPIEIKSRELIGKLFLASRAVDRGWSVVIGRDSTVREFMKTGPVGINIEPSIPERKLSRLKALKDAGFKNVSLCEENITYYDGEDYCNRKIGIKSIEQIELIFAVGEINKNDILKWRSNLHNKISVVGNPRFDILRKELRVIYSDKVNIIKKNFGNFLLVSSNFSRVNPNDIHRRFVNQLSKNGMIADVKHENYLKLEAEYHLLQMNGLKNLLEKFSSDNPTVKIILRPHPNENHAMWKSWARPLDVKVIFEGSANEWILASGALLHAGCTTGAEANILDKPSFVYHSNLETKFRGIGDFSSISVASSEELFKNLKNIGFFDENRLKTNINDKRFTKNFIEFDEFSYSSDLIIDSLEKITIVKSDLLDFKHSNFLKYLNSKIYEIYIKYFLNKKSIKNKKFSYLLENEVLVPITIWKNSGLIKVIPKISRLRNDLFLLQ